MSSDIYSFIVLQATTFSTDLKRIAIGKKIFTESCHAAFSRKSKELTLSYAARTRSSPKNQLVTLRLDLSGDDLKEVKYFRRDEALTGETLMVCSFVSLRIKKTDRNGLKKYTNAYDPDINSSKEKNYIVLEFRSDNDSFDQLLCNLQIDLPHFVNDLSQLNMNDEELYDYCGALCACDGKHVKRTEKASRTKEKSGFLANKDDDSVLVVYPFDGDTKKIDEAGNGLPVLSCNEGYSSEQTKTTLDNIESYQQIVIRARDYDCLDPEIYLNDMIIDFFCQW